MSIYRKSIGKIGEDFATKYIADHGYSILERNYTAHWAEIDIIARKRNKILFIEVKTRLASGKGEAFEAVKIPKLYHLMRSMQLFIKFKKFTNYKYQLDVIAVYLNRDKSLKEIKHYENIDMSQFVN